MTSVTKRSFSRGEVSPQIRGRADLAAWGNGLALCENCVVLKEGIISARGGTRFVGELKSSGAKGALIPFEYNAQQSFMVEFANGKARFYRDGGIVETSPGNAYELTTPWLTAQLSALSYTQSADVLYVAHPAVKTREIRRVADASWVIRNYEAVNGPFADMNPDDNRKVSASDVSGTVTLGAVGFVFTAADVGKYIRLDEMDRSATPKWVGNVAIAAPARVSVFGNTYEVVSGTNTGVNPPDHLEGDQQSQSNGGVVWRYLHSGFGIAKITGLASGGLYAVVNVIKRLPDQLTTTATYRWAMSPWSDISGYPGLVDFHEGRFVLAASPMQPATIWASQSDDFTNHEAGSKATDALNLTIAQRQVNAIRWLASAGVLGVGTSGREYTISPNSLKESLTPTNRKASPETSEGSAAIRPVETDKAVLFVSASRKRLHEYVYSLEEDGYVSPELSILADHITKRGIKRLAWDRDPNRIVWMNLDDGLLAGLTYRRDQQVAAWHRHPMLNGFVEDIATMFAPDGQSTQLWMIVRRQINGVTKRYIEVMQPVFDGTGKVDARDAWQLDCALRYDGAPATVISGLDHLEGEMVSILADGKVQAPREVAAGAITLDWPASRVLVGLPFTPHILTLPLDLDTAAGATTGKRKRITEIAVGLLDTVGGQVGVPDDLRLLSPSAGLMMGAAPPLDSSIVKVKPIGGWREEAQVEALQNQPLPFAIRTLTPDFEMED